MIDEQTSVADKISLLEKNLYHKDIQVSFLAHITKEINENASAETLFSRYSNFLKHEMGVEKMLLAFIEDERWIVKGQIGFDGYEEKDLTSYTELLSFNAPCPLSRKLQKELEGLEYFIPVKHKNLPLAFVLIGPFGAENVDKDNYEFISTITNIITVALENKRLFNRQLEQERFTHELFLAKEVQEMLMPTKWPQQETFKVSSIYRPLWNIGGDYLDCIEIDAHRMAFCIADVSGKGVAAAMLMANFQAILHQVIKSSMTLDHLIQELNTAIVRITNGEKSITVFIGEYNSKTKTLSYVNAGHVPPIIYSNGKMELLDCGTTLLGAVEKLPDFKVWHVPVNDDTLILLYTDGITDLVDTEGRYFEECILFDFIRKNADQDVKDFNKMLLHRLEDFTEEKNFPDDIAILTCKIAV